MKTRVESVFRVFCEFRGSSLCRKILVSREHVGLLQRRGSEWFVSACIAFLRFIGLSGFGCGSGTLRTARPAILAKAWASECLATLRPVLLLAGLFLPGGLIEAATYYVSPSGNDTNSGTISAPFFKVSKATSLAGPGDTIWMRGGTYYYTNLITITNSGTALSRIKLWAYTNEHPFLDFSAMADDPANRAFLVTSNANWWHFKGLEIYRAGDNGMKIEGSCHIIEQCVFHHCRDSGLQIGLGDSDPDDPTRVVSNQVINCDSYLNYDPRASGGNADGFCCKLHPGPGNTFKGCRSWENSDDGWDLYKNAFEVVLEDCWTWHNGDPASFNTNKAGNAEGFKIGGDSNFSGLRLLKRCIAFNNHYGGSSGGKAYHQNDHRGSITLYNCLSFSNSYNYALNNDVTVNEYMKNCVGFNGVTKNAATNSTCVQVSNSWNFATNVLVANPADYVVLTEDAAKAPRQADGSLPNNGFARLVAGSDLIDRGVDVGLPYTGSAPDLGPFEYAPQVVDTRTPKWFDTSRGRLHLTNGGFSMVLTGLTSHGPVLFYASTNLADWQPVHTNPPVTGSLPFVDASVGTLPRRFYRAEEQ